ncbi:MAG: hypothetical protein LW832_05640 [Parachlamydia sp.]|jgi:hypothetical protein|nr:hypothetical protein [Parachlamydia sp.]
MNINSAIDSIKPQLNDIISSMGILAGKGVTVLKSGGCYARLHPATSLVIVNIAFCEFSLWVCRLAAELLDDVLGSYDRSNREDSKLRFCFFITIATSVTLSVNTLFLSVFKLPISPVQSCGIILGTSCAYYTFKATSLKSYFRSIYA